MIRRNLQRMLDKYVAGTASPEERAILEAWFDSLGNQSPFLKDLSDEEVEKIGQELFESIEQRIAQLRHQTIGDLSGDPSRFEERYIDLIRHPGTANPLVHPFLAEDDPCFKPMLPYLPAIHRQILIWSQIDRLSIQELAVKLRLTTSGARSRLQRAHEKLLTIVRQCCTYQNDPHDTPLACIIRTLPGCCESATPIIQ